MNRASLASVRLTVIGAGIGLLIGVGLAASPHHDTVKPFDGSIPPCATEDSDNCYWDADTRGNREGHDSVVITLPFCSELPDGPLPDGTVCREDVSEVTK